MPGKAPALDFANPSTELNVMLLLDFVSKRYGKLPSEVMMTGNTFDFYIADLAASYQSWHYEQSRKNASNGVVNAPKAPNLSQEEMVAMIERVKRKANDDKTKS